MNATNATIDRDAINQEIVEAGYQLAGWPVRFDDAAGLFVVGGQGIDFPGYRPESMFDPTNRLAGKLRFALRGRAEVRVTFGHESKRANLGRGWFFTVRPL